MIIKLVEVFENKKFSQEAKRYAMREVFVNPDHVVCLRSEPSYGRLLQEGVLPEGLDTRQEFTYEQGSAWAGYHRCWVAIQH